VACGKGEGKCQVVQPSHGVLWVRRRGSLDASCLMVLEQKCQWSHALVCRNATFSADLSSFVNSWQNNQVNIPCFAILCWWKESSHDVI